MAANLSSANLQFSFGLGPGPAPIRREPESPFVMAILGDFSGRASRGLREPLADRRVYGVDCDNFDQVFARIQPKLRLATPGKPQENLEISLGSMEDFHPDKLARLLPHIAALLEKRKRLLNPASFAAAAAELQTLLSGASSQAPEPSSAAPVSTESDADTMARLLGGSPRAKPVEKPRPMGGALDRILKEAVSSSVVPGATPQQAALLSVLDIELPNYLRAVMHQPAFQALEAAWRGMDLLVRNFGGDENLKLRLIDISKEELLEDMLSNEQLGSSAVWKIIESAAQDNPWAVWLGLYTFGETAADLGALGRLTKIAAHAQAPFISGASPALVHCDSFGVHADQDDWKQPLSPDVRERWEAVRQLPGAQYSGLALPRFLLRLPYGKQTEPIDSFPFEELPANSAHETYLWGNSALLCGYLLASAFQANGWDMEDENSGEVGELPVHSFTQDGESNVKPCAEAWLTERAVQKILGQGLIPVLSIKGRDAVRVASLQSLAGAAFSIG